MCEVLVKKNGYVLVRLGSGEDKTMKYSYGSKIYLESEKKFKIIGTRKEIINSCKKDIKHCNNKLKKYKRRKIQTVIDFLEKEKEALKLFVFVLEETEV